MVSNYILAGIAAVFFILCVVSVMAERSPSDGAFSRNLFRRVKTTLREIGLLMYLIFAAVLIVLALKWDGLDIVWTCCSLAAIGLGLVILDSFRIFGRLGSRRRRKSKKSLSWVRENALTKEAAGTAEAKELPERKEAAPAPEKKERICV